MKTRLAPFVSVLVLACALSAAGRQSAPTQSAQRLAFPGKDWALDVAPNGFEMSLVDYDLKEPQVFVIGHGPDKKNRLMLVIKMKPARQAVAAAELRELEERARRKSGETHSTKNYEYKQIPVTKYRLGSVGPPSAFTSPHPAVAEAYLVRDDAWVTVTLTSMKSIGSKEEELFHSVLDSMRFVDTSRPSTSFDFFNKGLLFYLSKDYQRSIAPYRAALELERRERRLDVESWRRLVENLSNSYGAVNDLASAKEVVEYGLQQEPTYGFFHYTLARIHAASNDFDATVAALEKSFQYRPEPLKLLSVGLPFYDPNHDRVFDRFRGDEKFKRVSQAWKKK